MENTQTIKKRIKSVANINKITKAMELVAATKMRKAQETALASRPYAFAALDLLANVTLLEKSAKFPLPELLKKRKINPSTGSGQGKELFVVVASDKGLAGSFNSSVFKKFESYLKESNSEPSVASSSVKTMEDKKAMEGDTNKNIFVGVGEKSAAYLSKKGLPVLKKFIQVGDFTTAEQIEPLVDFIVQGYLRGVKKWPASNASGQPAELRSAMQADVANAGWDQVTVISMHFSSALKQEPHVQRILPVNYDDIKTTVQSIIPKTGKFAELIKDQDLKFAEADKNIKEYLIEPSPKVVLENLAKHLVFMQFYQLILEANAAEHSARRLAMKTASDNAADLSEKLNLEYNKSRQAGITNQIIEISAGAEALN